MASSQDLEKFYAKDREAWRAWLEKNHATARGVWLIYYKKDSGKPRVDYEDAVEEALCFGWIDSRPNKIDEESYMQLFSPRKPKSPWSNSNKRRVEKLLAQGRMTPAGLEKVEAAKRSGAWDRFAEVERMTIPEDLKQALKEYDSASIHFNAFSNSRKKAILWWIESAGRPETRQKRIEETARLASENIPANRYQKKPEN